ncbi:hypothetical protein E4U53_007794 [Claviceps sorghi]|nr:hypothetical protein E4U53_007794 [Claviceps sorghi]
MGRQPLGIDRSEHTAYRHHLVSQNEADRAREADSNASTLSLVKNLPPLDEARILFHHYANTVRPGCGLLHMPSCRDTLEQTYQTLGQKESLPSTESLLLLFSIFAGASFMWSPGLLAQLGSTRAEEARAALASYTRLAMSIIDSNERPLKPSSLALAAMTSLNFVTGQSRGLAYSAATLRMKCIVMAQSLRLGSLDTAKRTAERRRKGYDVIEMELQRRVWWYLVAGDWLCASSGGPNEGTYLFHPKHMNVRLPMNLEDEDLTPETIEKDVPLSVPTSMTAAIFRVKLSQLCRELTDTLPSPFQDEAEEEEGEGEGEGEADYDTILQMDHKLRGFLHELPVFFRLDAESVNKSRDVCRDMPFIALQRVSLNLAIYGRLCRLHRPFHLQDVKTSRHKYAYSHQACLADAQRLLDLRGMLEETGHLNGLQPTKSWIVVQHVSVAALILATEVSFDPSAPDAAARKSRVLATCELLDRAFEESGHIMEGVQKSVHMLLSTLQSQGGQTQTRQRVRDDGLAPRGLVTPNPSIDEAFGADATRQGLAMGHGPDAQGVLGHDAMDGWTGDDGTDWDQLWKDFISVAPEIDVSQWDALFEDVAM